MELADGAGEDVAGAEALGLVEGSVPGDVLPESDGDVDPLL